MALIIALCFLVLLSALVVGFFMSASTEFTSGANFSAGTKARMLGDSAVNTVMGQIQLATSRTNGAWASQPGMIRVYGENGSASTKLEALFKLYSSDHMIVTREEARKFRFADEVPTGVAGWNHQRAIFTDLNEPVRVVPRDSQTGKPIERYPIFDPRAFTEKDKDGNPAVEGFEVAADSDDDSGRLARMPVRWIYVLRDGTLTAPSSMDRDGLGAVWIEDGMNNRKPTRENPIVGRIAFWADDETSKVNINTAGGHIWKQDEKWLRAQKISGYREEDFAGSYWDTPRFANYFDRGGDLDQATGKIKPGMIAGLATAQPLSNEFQRYPGHPSVTSLGLVFQNYLNAEQIYRISPRLNGGKVTSLGGTNRLLNMTYWDPAFPAGLVGGRPVPIKDKRLYASVDELLYSPDSTPAGDRILNDNVLDDNKTAAGILTPDLLDRTRFFLTAHSRAPELNLYGRPRIAIWPIDANSKRRTAEDELIAFCSTVGPATDRRSFYFQRNDPYSPTNDANIARNRKLFDYLRTLTSQAVPGLSDGTFLAKYKADRNQILTEIFDYVRCVNLRDSSRNLDILKAHGNPAPNTSEWNSAQLEIESKQFAPRGIVLPLRVNRDGADSVGFGRISTVNQAALVLYHAGYISTKPGPHGEDVRYVDPREKEKLGVKANLVRAFLILETFNPMQGYAGVRNAADSPKRPGQKVGCDVQDNNLYIHEITGLDAFKIQSSSMSAPVPLGFPRRARNRLYYASAGWHSRNWGGYEGFSHTFWKKAAFAPGTTAFPSEEYYPFQTDAPGVAIPAGDQTLSFSGGKLNLDVFFGNRYGRKIVLDFPSATWPVPTDDIWLDEGGFDTTQAPPEWKWACTTARGSWARWALDPAGIAPVKTLAGRILWALYKSSNSPYSVTPSGSTTSEIIEWQTNRWRNILQPGDTVRSLIASGDIDPRSTALTTTPATFKPHPDYGTLTTGIKGPDGAPLPLRHAHMLRVAAGVPYMGAGNAGDKTGGSWRGSGERRGTYGGYWPGATTHSQMWLDYPITKFGNLVELPAGKSYPSDKAANVPPTINGVKRGDGRPGDFDTGIANLPDGAYCGKADEGTNAWGYLDTTRNLMVFEHPYYVRDREGYDSFFSANRQMPSAVMFGSLLNSRTNNWETLNFCPNPAGENHRGNASPPDHLLLDLFNMPIVRPYAISEPFSTAGKVNLNYQIVPFTYIKRSTALRAALESVRIPAVSTGEVSRYKGWAGTTNYRYLVDREEVIKSFDYYFSGFERGEVDKGIFKSASEICSRYLYPKNVSVSGRGVAFDPKGDRFIRAFWEGQRLTGDNLRERPYADLYPRLTTKSNTYTVHYRVQVLRKRAAASIDPKTAAEHYARWDEDKDSIAAEQRGSAVIERYLDPEDRRFNRDDPDTRKRGDFIDPDAASLDGAYRFRVVSSRRFLPW